MLSVAKVGSAGGAASYYTQEDNYYFLGEQSTEWFGKGAEQLGLKGAVDKDTFTDVLKGKLPDGSDLSHMRNGDNAHRPGYDYTFSAPKSVSLLALVKGDKGVLDAHKNAVKKVMTEIESLASTRTMVNGVPMIEPTRNVVAAFFMHDTNRNLDPHLHTHAVVSNVTFDESSGKFKTLSSDKANNSDGFVETTWNNEVAFGKLYRMFLREELALQGYEFESTGRNGLWEIKGIPETVLEQFSSRRQQILAAVGKDASNKSLTVAAKDTRQQKDFSQKEEVKQFWIEKFETLLGADFSVEQLKVSPEQIQARLETREQQIQAIDKALPVVVNEIAKEKSKFGRAEITDKIVDKVYFSGGGFSELVSERIDKMIENKSLIITDNKQNFFTTPEHLAKESVATSLISKLSTQTHNLKADTKTPIAQQIESSHSNFNLFSVRGRADYEAKLVRDIQNFADENGRQHIILVPTLKDKITLREKIGQEPYVYTVKDYLKSEYAEKSEQVLTLYRSDKMHLDSVSDVFAKNYTHQNTTILLDTGGFNRTGLIRDLAVDAGITDSLLKESTERKSIVMMSGVDKNDQIETAVKAYLNLAVTNKNVVIQAAQASNANTNIRDKLTERVRQSLLSHHLLGERTSALLSKEPVYLKRDENGRVDYSDPRNYQRGYTIERIEQGKTQQWTILNVDRRDKTISVINNETGEREKPWSLSKLNGNYQLFKSVKELEIRVGDKLHSMGKTNGLRANQNFTVVGITKGNSFFKQKIKLEDSQGKVFSINAGEESKLNYGYAEPIGRSQDGKRDVIISILQDNQTNDRTLSDVQKGSDRVLAITATNESVLAKRINKNSSQISVTRGLEKHYETKSLNEIKNESMSIVLGDFKLKQAADNVIAKLQEKPENKWVMFNGLDLVTTLGTKSRFTRQIITDYVLDKINGGEYLPVNQRENGIYTSFYLKESLDTERKLLGLMNDGIGTQEPLLPNAKILLKNTTLNESQRNAAEMILTNSDRIVSLQGLAGVGKTYQFNTVAGLLEQHRPDISIKALAPTHKAKEELLKAGMLKDGDTFANFLMESKGNEQRYDKTLFIIDESSMIGNSTGKELLETVVNRGGRIVLSGDHAQLSALESGDIFRLGQQFSRAAKMEMNQIVRQNDNGKLLLAVRSVAIEKNISKAFKFINAQSDSIIRRDAAFEVPKPISEIGEINKTSTKDNNQSELYQKVAVDYVSRSEYEQKNTQVITATNYHRIGLNEEIQSARAQMQDITDGITVPILRRDNLSEVDLKDANSWGQGQILKDGNNYFKVKSVDKNTGEIWVENAYGERMLNVADASNHLALFDSEKLNVYKGDIIRLNVTDKNRSVENNAFGEVISTENGKIQVDFGDNNIRTLDPINNEADRHFDLGYAITTMSSQGGSFKNVILFIDTDFKNFVDMKNAYVDISRVKDHLQVYVSDVDKYISLVESQSGARLTAYEIDNNIKLSDAIGQWENSKELMSIYNYKDRFEHNLITDNARLSFHDKATELLLATTDENGRYTGNIAIAVNPYRGEIDFSHIRADVTDDARFIVLNQGDSSQEMQVLSFSDLQLATEIEPDKNQTIIVALDPQDESLRLDDLLGKADEYDNLGLNDDKQLNELEREVILEDELGFSESERDKDDGEKSSQSSKLGQDEMNISYSESYDSHNTDEHKIDKGMKEKELV